jgi:hypothetical protein
MPKSFANLIKVGRPREARETKSIAFEPGTPGFSVIYGGP